MGEQMSAQEIKGIRGKYGLTQRAFAQLLGIGEASIARYESGSEPSKANANLIRAAANPRFMLDCFDRESESFPLPQRRRMEEVIYSLVTLNEEAEVMDVNQIYMITLDQEILNEKAALMIADLFRMIKTAEEAGDTVKAKCFEFILKEVWDRKRSITEPGNSTKEAVAKIKGSLDALKSLMTSVGTGAA